MRFNISTVIPMLAACALSTAASAHTGVDEASQMSFLTGFWHPVTGLDHLVAMVAVGLWSALAARRAGIKLLWGPLGFTSLLLLGALAGLQSISLPGVEPMIAASVLVLGLLVLTRRRLPGLVAASLVGGFALFHGVAHGVELAHSGNAWSALAGMLCATALLHAIGLAFGWVLRSADGWMPRAIGLAVAVWGGALMLQLA